MTLQILLKNETLIQALENEIGAQSTIYWLLISICAAIVWVVYLTYYNSRLIGLILTVIINRFVKYGHVHFGSFSVSVLSGKVMFRDVHYVTENYSLRIPLGLVIFRWWRPLTQKKINEDLSHSETRLTVYLDSFELHVYNRTGVYSRLEKLFGLDQLLTPTAADATPPVDEAASNRPRPDAQQSKWQWRDLIPVVKIEVTAGRVVFGNYLMPQTLSLNFGDAHLVYTTKPPSTPFDQFMHIIKCKSDNLRIMLVPSHKYTGKADEPPRCMGEGFVILQSSDVDIYYYMDEPGIVPYEPELVQLANGDVMAVRTWPCWGMDIKYGKNTDISYGPWADRQREFLWKFFYPPDYQPIEATVVPPPGQRRTWKSFDFKMSMQHDVTIDILFTKNKETQAVHMHSGQGTYLEFTIPFVVDSAGYVTKINGQLMHLDATTSLKFRSLIQCETLEFSVEIRYPQNWNEHQSWRLNLTACKASGYLVYWHKNFFQDLIEDWATRSRPDIFHFIPYTWHIEMVLKEFELLTLTNEWNWIDCFGHSPENSHLAVCGDTLTITYILPYDAFLPATVPIKFSISGEMAVARLYLPDTNTSRHLLVAISDSLRVLGRNGEVLTPSRSEEQTWSRICKKSAGWVDVWLTPIASVSINYTYHPIPPTGREPDEFAGTPDGEETILVPMRLVAQRPLRPKSRGKEWFDASGEFDPTKMESDKIDVDITVGQSVCYGYGSLVSNFLNLKENYFGDDQKFTDLETEVITMEKKMSMPDQRGSAYNPRGPDAGLPPTVTSPNDPNFDPRNYRPLHVTVKLSASDLQAHLVKNCTEDDAPCPTVFLERLAFELDKRYEETRLQVFLSPAVLVVRDQYQRPDSHAHLRDGHLALSGLQIRGHAMFSHKDLPLDSETLEYAWLLEVTIGDITGRLTAPQLQNIVEFLQTFVYLFLDPENSLLRPVAYRLCQHMVLQPDCKQHQALVAAANVAAAAAAAAATAASAAAAAAAAAAASTTASSSQFTTPGSVGPRHPTTAPIVHSSPPTLCPTSDDLKYRFVRLTIDCVDLYLVESGTALNVQVYPVRLTKCTLHSATTQSGISVLIPHVSAKQFVLSVPITVRYDDRLGSNPPPPNVCWLEAGGVGLGPIIVDATLALPNPELLHAQRNFIAVHDRRTRRLSFLWGRADVCGCMGGSRFFGDNRNGPTVFHPSERDFIDGINAAVVRICKDGVNYGFGQSIFRPMQPIFDQVRPRRSHLRELIEAVKQAAAPAGTSANQTLSPDAGKSSDEISSPEHERPPVPRRLSSVEEQTKPTSSSDVTGSTSDVPMSPGPRNISGISALPLIPSGSVCSLSDTGIPIRKSCGHGRTYSYDPPKTFSTAEKSATSEMSVPPALIHDIGQSRGSLRSSSGSHSRRSSLTSPVLRRLSSQISIQEESDVALGPTGSLVSVVSSEQFYSAGEEERASMMSIGSARRTIPTPRPDAASPTSDDFTGSSSVYDMALESPDVAGSSTDVDSFVSAAEDHSVASAAGVVIDETMKPQENTSDDLDDDDDDVATYAAEDETVADDSFDTDATQVPAAPCYVDLHGQINQPITKSPLLMSCYTNHMTQLACANWTAPVPRISESVNQIADGSGTSLTPARAAAGIPQFSYTVEGFTPALMAERSADGTATPGSPFSSSHVNADEKQRFFSNSSQNNSHTDTTEPAPANVSHSQVDPLTYEGHINKTTAVVNLKGSVDIMVSPLMLEALQRYIEAVTPVLSTLHPSSVIDGLHFQCTSAVEEQNKLKAAKEQHRPVLTMDQTDKKKSTKEQRRFGKKQAARTAEPEKVASGNKADVEQGKCQMSRLQVMLSLSKINICVVQASLVEEIISISALERARELTCVSVLAASIDHVALQLLTSAVTRRVDPESAGKPQTLLAPKPLAPDAEGNADMEIHRDDIVASLNISRVHLQLRRMKRHSNFSDQVFLTAIPEGRSQAFFSFRPQGDASGAPATTPYHEDVFVDRPPYSKTNSSRSTGSSNASDVEDIAGFIMFECGFENIMVQIARRKGYEPIFPPASISPENPVDSASVAPASCNIISEVPASPLKAASEKASVTEPFQDGNVERMSPDMDDRSSRTSGDGNTADDEASWRQSRTSISVDEDSSPITKDPPTSISDRLSGDAASCVLEFRTVWFNFAAPPPSPRKRKLEYTRYDWNLLSTATPAINSWMNPCHRAIQASDVLYARLSKRMCTLMACIMTEALDMQNIHMPFRSKYSKITDLSRALQEDPSCQLLTVLRRYVHAVGVKAIEGSLNEETLPQSLTIKKGLLVLTRQWKNVLYMPALVEASFKTKKKMTVTFAAIPINENSESADPLPVQTPVVAVSSGDDADAGLDNFDTVDEKTSLLRAEGGSMAQSAAERDRFSTGISNEQGGRPAVDTNVFGGGLTPPIAGNIGSSAARLGASNMSLMSSSDGVAEWVDASEDRVLTATSHTPSVASSTPNPRPSLSRQLTEMGAAAGSAPQTSGAQSVGAAATSLSGGDMVTWMKKQQDFTATRLMSQRQTSSSSAAAAGIGTFSCRPPSVGQMSLPFNTGASEPSQDDSTDIEQRRFATAMTHQAFQLADAQVLFKPLLASMGLQSVQVSAVMKELGGSLSLRGGLNALRINIVDSVFSVPRMTSSARSSDTFRAKPKRSPHFHIDTSTEMPAFICESFNVQLSTRDLDAVDGPVIAAIADEFQPNFLASEVFAATLTEELRRRQSMRSLHTAMGRVADAARLTNAATTRVDFVVSCHTMTQHVNMSLLRLAHQFATMIENIAKTRSELRGEAALASYMQHDIAAPSGGWTRFDSQHHQRTLSGDSGTMSDTNLRPQVSVPVLDHRKNRPPLTRPASLPGVPVRAKSDQPLDTAVSIDIDDDEGEINMGANATGEVSSPAITEERTIVDEIRENTPKCWCNLYHLLNLYSTMPELKTVNTRSQLSVIEEEDLAATSAASAVSATGIERGARQPSQGPRDHDSEEHHPLLTSPLKFLKSEKKTSPVGAFTQSVVINEKTTIIVFGVARVKRVRISALLSGLKLEADLENGQASATYREKIKGVLKRKSFESSVTASVGHTMIVLLEGVAPSMQTVVTVNVDKSQGLYSSLVKRSAAKHNSGLLTVGLVDVDIPQHPVALHGMVARSSKRLSSTLQEFIRLPSTPRVRPGDVTDGSTATSSSMSRLQMGQRYTMLSVPPRFAVSSVIPGTGSTQRSTSASRGGIAPLTARLTRVPATSPSTPSATQGSTPAVSKPFVIHFRAQLNGLTVGASLLPSLRAQYKIGEVTSSGVTGSKAQFTINLPTHSLSFSSKVPARRRSSMHSPSGARRRSLDRREIPTTPGNLPSSASIDMPPVHIYAVYLQHDAGALPNFDAESPSGLAEGLTVREGNYLKATADVGEFQHILTTDLLNHLVFVQKVFMKEVNELVQKVSGADQPVPFWADDNFFHQERNVSKPLLYSFLFRLKGIQITATTPTNNAVRLETGVIELELSNRVQRVPDPNARQADFAPSIDVPLKVFVRAVVDLNLALGTLLKNAMFEEAEAEFQHLASFQTRITLRNALQDEMIPGVSKDQEALMIALKRPIIFVLPAAFDKAVLVWLNYKNAYEYWTEQRLALNKEVQTATQQFLLKIPPLATSHHPLPHSVPSATGASTPTTPGTLFLQLTVDDLGICLPMNQFTQGAMPATNKIDEPGAALVLTLESTQISACSCGSLVSKGRFKGFCLRFADDFQVSWDDWKPDSKLDFVMNALVVPHGTYEVCSQTINPRPAVSDPYTINAKWILSIQWQMRGIDIHLDTNIGKRLSAMGNTLTMLAGDQFDGYDENAGSVETARTVPMVNVEPPSRKQSTVASSTETLPAFVYDTRLDPKTRARMVENEMNEQAKLVQDLHQLRASRNTIEIEERKLHDLQAVLFRDFRQDIVKRLRRQSGVRTSTIKDKLGLITKPSHSRSQSTGMAQSRRSQDSSSRSSHHKKSSLVSEHTPRLTHSRTVSVDNADYCPPSNNDLLPHFSITGGQPSDDFSYAALLEEDSSSSPTAPTVAPLPDAAEGTDVNMLPMPILEKIPSEELSDTSAESYIDELKAFFPHRVPGRTSVSIATSDSGRADKIPSPSNASQTGSGGTGSTGGKVTQELSVDFELDVKVDIDSGKCVLHPKEPKSDSEQDTKRPGKGHPPSPRMAERKKSGTSKKITLDTSALSSSRLTSLPMPTNKTVFFLPGVDVKVHYSSRTAPASESESPMAGPSSQQDFPSPFGLFGAARTSSAAMNQTDSTEMPGVASSATTASSTKKNTVKKANLYAWLMIPPLPEEMLISPALLDFLEQALEPLPVSVQLAGAASSSRTGKNAGRSTTVELDTSATSLVSSTNYAYASFPVDVVVYIRVQPSLIRFTCLPVSRVECLLRFPSVDVVFSSKKADIEGAGIAGEASPTTGGKSAGAVPRYSTGSGIPSSASRSSTGSARLRTMSGVPGDSSQLGGGLSVTGSLSNFSLYIFHPYGGGGQKKTSLAALENTFRRAATRSGMDERTTGGATVDSGRKDSLSLNVEFVKVNISRSRKGFVSADAYPNSLSSSYNSPMNSSTSAKFSTSLDGQMAAANIVRFSAVCDIGSASFKYDMRRLLEILALPKAWYRRSLARRIFLGEEVTMPDANSESDDDANEVVIDLSSSQSDTSSLFSPFEKDKKDTTKLSSVVDHKAQLGTGQFEGVQLRNLPKQASKVSDAKVVMHGHSPFMPPVLRGSGGKQSVRNWQTLVLFAAKLSQLDIVVNMSNVMGNTVWSMRDLTSEGRFSIDSSGYKNMKISAALGGSKLDARGGIIGGNIEMQQLHSEISVSEDPGKEPEHMVIFDLHVLEARLDYMGSSILMGRISDLAVKLNDEWHVETGKTDDRRASSTTSRSVLVFVHGDLVWDRFHLMISRSTTPELIKMVHKLDEFISQQRTSSKRVLSVFGPASSSAKAKPKQKEEDSSWISEIRHHRHWQAVLKHMGGSHMSMLACKLPEHGTIIGGTMSLQGRNITLACFHGINFRSKSWALFTMDDPYICFATEAADVIEDGEQCTHVTQNLSFQLGQYQTGMLAEKKPMALICKLSRGHYMPPPFTSVQDWFHYAFATSEVKDLDTFPVMARLEAETNNVAERRGASRRAAEYTHDTEIIFILPSLQMHLKTEHMQGENEPQDDEPKPVVECSFVTEFEDHIFVAMDAEAVLFIHDLVINYVREKDRGSARAPRSPEVERQQQQQKLDDPTSVLKQDYRTFNCETWHLEPTVRLLSWAGKRIDPVGVDYILQKLGFQHARLTIPKWMQRGCMDPLDKIVSVLVDKLIVTLREQSEEDEEQETVLAVAAAASH